MLPLPFSSYALAMLADQAVPAGVAALIGLGIALALTPHHTPACPEPIPVADLIVKPGATVVFGEIHGTREIPVAFGAIVCHAAAQAPLIVGLEMSRDEQPRLDRYLASDGGRAAREDLLAGPHWHV